MKSITAAFFTVSLLLCGCSGMFEQNNARVAAMDQEMSVDWLKSHVVIGKTTTDDILAWYGKPLMQSSSAGSPFMPDEIWTYSVRFTKVTNSWSGGSTDYWTKAIAFSFKNGVVINYNVTSTAF
jgi:hypothetical protein